MKEPLTRSDRIWMVLIALLTIDALVTGSVHAFEGHGWRAMASGFMLACGVVALITVFSE